MASSLSAQLSPDLRTAIALSINRQGLVNQLGSWAVPGLVVANSHIYVQGQQGYKPAPTTAVADDDDPGPDVVHLDDRRRCGRQRELPGDAGPGPGGRLPHRDGPGPDAGLAVLARGTSTSRSRCAWSCDESDPWAAQAAPAHQGRPHRGRVGHERGRRELGHAGGRGAGGRLCGHRLATRRLHAVPEPDAGLVHPAARVAGEGRLGGLDGLREHRNSTSWCRRPRSS